MNTILPPFAAPFKRGPRALPPLFITALLLASLGALLFQGTRGLYESTEGRYAQCAKESLETGNLLEPILSGEHHWSKPPLAYAGIAVGIRLLGNNAWGARIVQSGLFVLTVGFIFLAGRALWHAEAGAMAALVYASSPFTLGAASVVSTDNMLALFQCAAVAFFWMGIRNSQRKYIYAAWASLGFAFLTKGPVALLPLAGVLPGYLVARRHRAEIIPVAPAPAVATFVLIGLSWYAVEIFRHPELLNLWLIHETFGRLTSDEYHRNAEFHKIFTLYLPILLFGSGTWLLLLILRLRKTGFDVLRMDQAKSPDAWTYIIAGALLPTVFFCLSQSRLPLYLLPIFTPISLALGKLLSNLVRSSELRQRTVVVTACTLVLLMVLLKLAAGHYPSRKNMAQLAENLHAAIEAHPQSPMVLLSNEPLHGLEFYLNRPIPAHPFPTFTANPSAELGSCDTFPPGTLVLMRRKHYASAASLLPAGLCTPLYEGPFWTLVELNRALTLPSGDITS